MVHSRLWSVLLGAATLSTTGCNCDSPPMEDADMQMDAAVTRDDAGRPDARPDAGSDAGTDTGPDAPVPFDMGIPDAFVMMDDAAVDDAFVNDAGTDAGPPDATFDAPIVDAGNDANNDAGPPEGPPVTIPGAVPDPGHVIYEDLGTADTSAGIRGLVVFPLTNEATLDAELLDIYNPASPSFRDYMTFDEWMTQHAPNAADVLYVRDWMIAQGFTVPRIATNRMMFEFQGTVDQFNRTFGVTLHLLHKVEGYDAYVFGTDDTVTMPSMIAARVAGIIGTDLLPEMRALPGEAGAATSTPPPDNFGYSPQRMARAYGIEPLQTAGNRGAGQRIGVVAGATFKFYDVRSFWAGFGIRRADPIVRVVMPPITTRYLETTIDVEWAGAQAPDAELYVYEGPDVRDTSLIYTFNEAIGLHEVDVLTISFAHRETSEPAFVRWTNHRAAKMAAALGITVVAAAGDSNMPDTPGTSWWVTSVGGTLPNTTEAGDWLGEAAWPITGHGESLTIPAPPWQASVSSARRRVVNDISLNGGRAYWTYWLGNWTRGWTGTSFSAPNMAGLVAVVNSARAVRGEPNVGALNPILYTVPAVQASFRDITSGTAGTATATVGWDEVSGWGSPRADLLEAAIP